MRIVIFIGAMVTIWRLTNADSVFVPVGLSVDVNRDHCAFAYDEISLDI